MHACMHGFMGDGWLNGCMEGRMHAWMHRCMEDRIAEWMYGCMNAWRDG